MKELIAITEQIAAKLIANKQTIAIAESSTGGLLSASSSQRALRLCGEFSPRLAPPMWGRLHRRSRPVRGSPCPGFRRPA